MAGSPNEKSDGFRVVVSNRRAFHDYTIFEKIETGVELRGAEVKSIRAGQVSLSEGYASVEAGQLYIYGLHILPYAHARQDTHEAERPKRLLLHRHEINRLVGQLTVKGNTLIPLQLYLKRGLVKLELGVGRGKQLIDKRETLKRKTADREIARAITARVKR